MSDNRDLRKSEQKKSHFYKMYFRFEKQNDELNLPVKLLGQIHIGFELASTVQVPPLKQYGIEPLHGLRRTSQKLKMN